MFIQNAASAHSHKHKREHGLVLAARICTALGQSRAQDQLHGEHFGSREGGAGMAVV